MKISDINCVFNHETHEKVNVRMKMWKVIIEVLILLQFSVIHGFSRIT